MISAALPTFIRSRQCDDAEIVGELEAHIHKRAKTARAVLNFSALFFVFLWLKSYIRRPRHFVERKNNKILLALLRQTCGITFWMLVRPSHQLEFVYHVKFSENSDQTRSVEPDENALLFNTI